MDHDADCRCDACRVDRMIRDGIERCARQQFAQAVDMFDTSERIPPDGGSERGT